MSTPVPLIYLTYYNATSILVSKLSSYIVADLEVIGERLIEHYENEIEEISVIF
jgi:hypothetical protein